MIATAMVLLLFGAFAFWLPIPIGLPLLLIGLKLLLHSSVAARRRLVRLMRRQPRVRRLLDVRKRVPLRARGL